MQQLFFQQIFLFFFKKHYKLIIDFLKIIVLKFLSKLEKGDVKKLPLVYQKFLYCFFSKFLLFYRKRFTVIQFFIVFNIFHSRDTGDVY